MSLFPSLLLANRIARKITNEILANSTLKRRTIRDNFKLNIGCTFSHLVTSSTNPNRGI